jgi:AraC family transcriptional regulator
MLFVETRSVESRLASAAMFVRSHLDERITLEGIADVAGFSPFHFHRIFRVAFGENLNAYVMRRRLQRAARELARGTDSITDIGLRCGYESPSAFGRAFARAFGMTPSAYRAAPDPSIFALVGDVLAPETNARADAAPRRHPQHVDGRPRVPRRPDLIEAAGSPANASAESSDRVERYTERKALGIRHTGPYDRVDATLFRVYEIARRRGLLGAGRLLGLSYDSPDLEAHDTLRFDACITLETSGDIDAARADGLRDLTIAGGDYAVFRHRGPYERVTHAYDRLIAAWILTGRFVLRDAPFINTYYSDPAHVAASDLECDLAIPILLP